MVQGIVAAISPAPAGVNHAVPGLEHPLSVRTLDGRNPGHFFWVPSPDDRLVVSHGGVPNLGQDDGCRTYPHDHRPVLGFVVLSVEEGVDSLLSVLVLLFLLVPSCFSGFDGAADLKRYVPAAPR